MVRPLYGPLYAASTASSYGWRGGKSTMILTEVRLFEACWFWSRNSVSAIAPGELNPEPSSEGQSPTHY